MLSRINASSVENRGRNGCAFPGLAASLVSRRAALFPGRRSAGHPLEVEGRSVCFEFRGRFQHGLNDSLT